MPLMTADTGALTATTAQMCNVSGSMGMAHWYRLAATLPGAPTSYVQLELWDKLGAFDGTTVHIGMFQITGRDADPSTCGVCLRGLGNKGASGAKEYFATGGTVNVTAVGGNGQPISATLTDVSFVEINPASRQSVANGCMATVESAQVTGTVMQVGGGGGACPSGVGD